MLFAVRAGAQTRAEAIADSLYATGDYIHAINAYSKVGNRASGLQIARAYKAVGNYDKAIKQYEALAAGNIDLQVVRFELGRLYSKTKRTHQARELFLSLSQNNADNPEYHYHLGAAYQDLGRTRESISSYKKAVALDRTHLRSLFRLGKYYVAQREKDSALSFVDHGLEFYADDVSLINLKALAYYNNDQYGKALPFFERLVELGEQKQYIYEKLAFCYFKSWEFEKAKTTYKVVLVMDPDNAEAHFNLGQVFWKEEQLDSVRFHVKRSIELQDPILSREYDALARLARQENDLKSAFEYYKLAYAEDTSNYLIYFNMCTVADQYLTDPQRKLDYYGSFIEKFGRKKPYCSEFSQRRITELREEIHFVQE